MRVPILLLLAGIISTLADAPTAAAQGADVQIREWEVPWESTRPRDPYMAPNGMVWFTGQAGGYLGALNPLTGSIERFELPAGEGAHNVIVGGDGYVWYAGNRTGNIGRMHPETGEIKLYPMPVEAARDPHTLVWAPDGSIWFSLQGANMIGHLNIETEEVRLIDVPGQRNRPYGIWMDSKGSPWVALFGTNKVARVDPETMELEIVDFPDESTRPRRLVITSDDKIYVGDYSRGYLIRYNPEDGSFKEWQMPSMDAARPYAMSIDNEDRIWFVETGVEPNIFTAFDPETEAFMHATTIPSGGGTVRHMYYHEPSNAIWFGTDTNYIGRAILPPKDAS